MYIALTILIVIAAILLVLLVLVQNSKGGGLAAGFNSGNQVMGVRKTTDFIEKATWSVIAFIVLLSVFAAGAKKSEVSNSSDEAVLEAAAEEQVENAGVDAFGDNAND